VSTKFARLAVFFVCVPVVLALLSAPFIRAQSEMMLVTTGSSLPEPLYLAWGDAYHKLHPDTQVRYLPEGSAESGRKILAGIGDMGGGDAPNPEKQLKAAAVPVLELPSVLIGIVLVYNLPQTAGELRFTGPMLADIFLGKIRMWNDPAIVKLNQEIKLPAKPIQLIHRSAGKGSNYIFSDYLSKVSPEFSAKLGRSESPNWPVGLTAGRAQDMSDMVKDTPWSLGYTELNIAQTASLRIARVRNAAGEFILPTVKSIEAAAAQSKFRDDFRVSLTNTPGKDSYPITSFTWLYVPTQSKDPERGRAVAEYLKWVYTDGQRIAQERGYATLPGELLAKVAATAATVR
jgi:phosphate transport system substrate-binding protein